MIIIAITYNAGANLITLTGDGINPTGGTSWVNAYDEDDIVGAVAVATKQGDSAYFIPARLKFESNVYFVSKNSFVELKPNPINPVYTIRADAGTHIRLGEYNAVDGYGHSGAFWDVYLQSTTGSQNATGNRLMGEFLLYGSNFICDSTSFTRGPHFVDGATIRLYNSICKWAGYFWAPNCNMQDIKFHGGGGTYDMLFATGYDYSFSGVTSIGCNYGLFFSSTTNAPVDVYNHKFLNCTYDIGLISTTHLIRVINSPFTTYYPVGSGKSFKECYTFNVKVTDDQGSPIVGAMVSLKDVDGTNAFPPVQTVAGGVLPADEIVVRKWFRNAAQGGIKDYNDHTLKVTNGADETEYKIKIDHKMSEDVVLLPQAIASYDNIMEGINDIKGTGFVKDVHSLKPILDDVTGLGGAPMIGTDGAYTGTPPTTAEIKDEIEGVGTKLTSVKDQTDKMNFTGTDVKATLDSEEVTTDTTSRDASKATGFATSNEYDIILTEIKQFSNNRLEIHEATSELWLYDDAGINVIKKWPLTDRDHRDIILVGAGPANRGKRKS